MPRARCPPRPLVLTGPCDRRMDLLSKHHVPDDDSLDAAAHRWWLADISRTDTTVDTPRHLFWGGTNSDADDSPTVDFSLLKGERDAAEPADEATQAIVLASVIPLRPETQELADDLPAAGSPTEVPAPRGGRRLRRPVLVGAAALACVLTVLAGTSSAQSKHVALVVDGQTRYVDTRADTVTAVLASAGVNVGAHDTLAPAGSAAISDGSTIVLNHGQQLTVNVGGQAEQIWTTTTKAAAIEQAAAQVARPAPAAAATATAAPPVVSTEAHVSATSRPSAKVSTSATAGQSVVVAPAVKAKTPTVVTAPSTQKATTPPKAKATVTSSASAAGSGTTAANAVLGTVTITDPNRQTANAQAIYEFFRDNGATAAGAAGITGNFIDESSTSPTAVNGAGFYGIEQWGGSRWDGPDSLNAFAADHGTSWDDLHTQLEFSLFELGLTTWTDKSGTTHTAPSWVTPGGAVITDVSITDPQAAALRFEEAAEGCEPADSCGLDVRQLAAQEVYDALKGYVPTGPHAGPAKS